MVQARYLECPGGTGKKIKFCCPDLVSKWEKILRLVEGEQYQACLRLIAQLEERYPDRPCLLAIKIETLLHLNRRSEIPQVVEHFLQKHPDNPVALLEKAYVTAFDEEKDIQEAYQWLLRGFEQCKEKYPACLLRVVYWLATRLMASGHYAASQALLWTGSQVSGDWHKVYEESADLLDKNSSVSVVIRESFFWRPELLENTPVSEPFQEIHEKINRYYWISAAEQLQQLTETYPQEPGLWWHLGVLRSWLLDIPGAIEALRRYASLGVSEDEAILAEAAAIALSPDPLGDLTSQYELDYTPDDVAALQTALSLSKQTAPCYTPSSFLGKEKDVPPRAQYFLLDRPRLDSDQTPSEENVPNILAIAALFGRQTDREARLEVYNVYDGNRSQVETLLGQFVGQGLRPDPVVKKIRDISTTQCYFWGDVLFPDNENNPTTCPSETEIRQKRFLDLWLDQPLGIFDGKSPRQAAQDPQFKIRLEAVLLWVENITLDVGFPLSQSRLRQELGLSPRKPIDPEQTPLSTLPLFRWADADVDKLSDSEIARSFAYASHFMWEPAMDRFAKVFLQRPSLAKSPVWGSAVYYLALMAIPSDEAGTLIEQGRQHGNSCAIWDVLEVKYHIQRGELEVLKPLLQHFVEEHKYEEDVVNDLIGLLAHYRFFSPEEIEQEGAVAASAEEPSELWTPDSGGHPNSPKKLWTPGMS